MKMCMLRAFLSIILRYLTRPQSLALDGGNGLGSLSYNITGGGAPISRQSKKCRQKHGGFSCLLTPIGSSGSWRLPLTNRDPTLEIKSFTPCYVFS